jgi:hypothetical protein
MRSSVRKKSSNPYKECELCEDLGDCPYPEIENNMLGTPMCPDVCPKPITVMANTLKRRKHE